MVAAGSVKNFYSLNSTLANGVSREPKPWNDTGEWPADNDELSVQLNSTPLIPVDPRAERSFYLARDKWYPTWKKPSLEVDYIKIYAV